MGEIIREVGREKVKAYQSSFLFEEDKTNNKFRLYWKVLCCHIYIKKLKKQLKEQKCNLKFPNQKNRNQRKLDQFNKRQKQRKNIKSKVNRRNKGIIFIMR